MRDQPLDLRQFDVWMQECGPHDYGIYVGGCGCPPDKDVRPVILALVREIERLRKEAAE